MSTLIRIDRSSIKRNPDAGRTDFTRAGNVSVHATREGDEYESIGPVSFSDEKLSGRFVKVAGSPPVGIESEMQFVPAEAEVKRDIQHFRTRPAPMWLYGYEPTPITCDNCGRTFPHTDLREVDGVDGDGDDFTAYVCPHCGEPDCCEMESENIADVVRELGLSR